MEAIVFAAWTTIIAILAVEAAFPMEQFETFSLEQLVPPKREFYPTLWQETWISESEFAYMVPEVGLKKFNAENKSDEVILSNSDLGNLKKGVASYGQNGRYLLLVSDQTKIYRYSSVAKYSIFDVANRTFWPLAKGQPIQTVVWSLGDTPSLAYVQDNNVYYVADVNEPSAVQLTQGGVPGEVYHGVPDWIYEEEVFGSDAAMWFSPQGTYLAVASFNDSLVDNATYELYGSPGLNDFQYPKVVNFKYPKAGRVNPSVSLNVFPLTNTVTETKPIINIPAPYEVVGVDHVLGSVQWSSPDTVVVLWLNRRQNKSVLMSCDMPTATCDDKRIQEEPKGWIDVNPILFDKFGARMIDIQPSMGPIDRQNHVILQNLVDNTLQDLSPGNMTVRTISAWDQDFDCVYFVISPRDVPWEKQLWSNTKGVVQCLSCSLPNCKSASADFSPETKFALISCSEFGKVPTMYLYDTTKKEFSLWQENSMLNATLSNYLQPDSQFLMTTLPSGSPAHIHLMIPPQLKYGLKHPLVVQVYAGPGTTRVADQFELNYNTYLTTNRSYVVAHVDVRGSGAMGVDAMHAVNNALGTVEILDTLEAINFIVKNTSYIDPERVAVWGWSYGGYASAMMLARDRRRQLVCAASVAPVTSWLYYDTIYTERYMDLPSSNLVAYQHADLTLQAEKFRGRKLLLVHGNADDNVHYQHSMMLARQLQRADIEFDEMSYPDENHALSGVSKHLYHTLDRYWSECFAERSSPILGYKHLP